MAGSGVTQEDLDAMTPAEFYKWATTAPTGADIQRQSKAIADADRQASIAAYRAAHPESAKMTDATVLSLIYLHTFAPKGATR